MENKQYTPFKEWFFQSDYDFETAEAMFTASRYVYCVFMCHLSIEKTLKALIVKNLNRVPPKSHNLMYLIEQLGLELPQDLVKFVFRLNDAAIPTRYPQDLAKAIGFYSKEIALEILELTKRTRQWIKQQ